MWNSNPLPNGQRFLFQASCFDWAVSAVSSFVRRSAVVPSVRLPFASNRVPALGYNTSGLLIGRMSRKIMTCSRRYCARIEPDVPAEQPNLPTDLPLNG